MEIIRTTRHAQVDNLFTSQVEVDVYGDGLDLDITSVKVQVRYQIEIEYRDWGIKGFSVIPQGVITVPLRTDAGQDFSISVDCSQVKTEVVGGSGVWISGLTLHLVGQQVDYNRSNFDIVFGA